MSLVMVLNDGETFSPLKDCKVVETQEDVDAEYIEDLIAEPGAATVYEFGEELLVLDMETRCKVADILNDPGFGGAMSVLEQVAEKLQIKGRYEEENGNA